MGIDWKKITHGIRRRNTGNLVLPPSNNDLSRNRI